MVFRQLLFDFVILNVVKDPVIFLNWMLRSLNSA